MEIGVHLLDGTLGTPHLGGSGHLILLAGTVDSHLILTLGSLGLCFHRLVVGIRLITLLGTHHALVEQTLHSLI